MDNFLTLNEAKNYLRIDYDDDDYGCNLYWLQLWIISKTP